MNFIKKFRGDLSKEDKTKILDDIFSSFIEVMDVGALLCVSDKSGNKGYGVYGTDLYSIEDDRDKILSLDWNNITFDIRDNAHYKPLKECQRTLEFVLKNLKSMEDRFKLENDSILLTKDSAIVWLYVDEEVLGLPISSDFRNGIDPQSLKFGMKIFHGNSYSTIDTKDALRNYIISYKIVRKNLINRFI